MAAAANSQQSGPGIECGQTAAAVIARQIIAPGDSIVPQIDVQQASEDYFTRIHRAALVMTGSPWDADDLAQETFLELAQKSDRFEGRSSLYTWLYGILLNLDRRRRRRAGMWQQKLRVVRDAAADNPRRATPADVRLEVDEWRRSLWSIVATLPEGQRQVLVLRFSERLTYEEIAGVLDCPLGTVKSRIHHGLAALRERLAPDANGTGEVSIPPLALSRGQADVG